MSQILAEVPSAIEIYASTYDVKSGKLLEVPAATAAGRASFQLRRLHGQRSIRKPPPLTCDT